MHLHAIIGLSTRVRQIRLPLGIFLLLSLTAAPRAMATTQRASAGQEPPIAGESEPSFQPAGITPPIAGEEPLPAAGAGLAPPIAGEAPPAQAGNFWNHLRVWLGKFHPPAANFPVALLVAAALAELLWMILGKRLFDDASRYCIWFGGLAAIVTGTLGWFMGGFQATDTSWSLMLHRWLGTSTDILAVLALILSEIGRRPGRRGFRLAFRGLIFLVAAMVLATGYFGGAQIYGLNHYAWP